MDRHYDVIVLGVGGMGSAAVYQLAKRGARVLGIERYDIPHAMGSSHGVNRIIRMAYFENPDYVPLLRRAYELWRQLEDETGERLLVITGGIDAAPPDHPVFEGSLQSCRLHDLAHETLTASEVNQRFPGYRLPEAHMAVYQPDGGYVMSELAVGAHVNRALAMGAEVHGREAVLGWDMKGERVEVVTEHARYTADQLVITAGAWSADFGIPPSLAVPERQVLGWFQPRVPANYQPETFPIFNLEIDAGHYYGFPVETVPGFKIGLYHHLRQNVDPDLMDREPNATDVAVLREAVDQVFPDASGPVLSLKTCLFTNSPDEHFIIDRLRDAPSVVVAGGFSGHGFKFSSVVGEILADVVGGETAHDISLFSLDRFREPAG